MTILTERGALDPPFRESHKNYGSFSSYKIHNPLYVVHPNNFTHNVRDPSNLSAELLRLQDSSFTQRIGMTQSRCPLLPNRLVIVPEGSQQAGKGNLDQKQHIFHHNPAQLGFRMPEPRFPYSSPILSPATQQIPGTPKPDMPS